MKKWMLTCLLLLLIGLAGCTATIYGVPQERWETMGEQERVAAMEAFRAQHSARQVQREERARRQALERERQRAIEAEEARQRQLQIVATYRGEGAYGDLLRVSIQGGHLKLNGAHRSYHPVAFKVAAGETKEVHVVSLDGRVATMVVGYDGSTLLLDDSAGGERSRAARLVYEEAWEKGKVHAGLNAGGPLELRGVNVKVQVLGEPLREGQAGRRPQVIVIQQAAPDPEKTKIVVITEKERRPPQPQTMAAQEPPMGGRPEGVEKNKPVPEQATDSPPSRVKVTFHQGQIRIKGEKYPITPQSIDLGEGEARTIALQGRLGKVKVRVSYRGGEIAIDDHPGKGGSDALMTFSREWRAGSTYWIRTTGSRLIEDLDISVLAL